MRRVPEGPPSSRGDGDGKIPLGWGGAAGRDVATCQLGPLGPRFPRSGLLSVIRSSSHSLPVRLLALPPRDWAATAVGARARSQKQLWLLPDPGAPLWVPGCSHSP